jgi:hypothetical protein
MYTKTIFTTIRRRRFHQITAKAAPTIAEIAVMLSPLKRFTACLLGVLMLGLAKPAEATVIYADANATKNGSGTQSSPFDNFDDAYQAASANDVIDLTGTFDWSVQTTNITSPEGYTISENLTIRGQGMNSTIVQAQSSKGTSINRSVFTINATVTIKNLTIRYGYLSTYGSYGAGITIGSNDLTIESCKIADNVYNATGLGDGSAGGISSDGGSLTIIDCQVSNNTKKNYYKEGAAGVAIADGSSLTIKRSTFNGNTFSTSSPLSSASYKNPAGAVISYQTASEITNSTFYNNSTNGAGGAMNLYNSDFMLTNNTIVNNSSTNNKGGGIAFGSTFSGRELVLKNNLIANNSGPNNDDDIHVYKNYNNIVTDNGYNIIENTSGNSFTTVTSTVTSNQSNLFGSNQSTSPSLKDNNTKNNTKTLALSSGSVAIDAGSSTSHSDGNNNTTINPPSKDQRDAGRNGTTDIGSYEWNGPNGALPVEMLSFNAELIGEAVELTWATASETNNRHFVVQKRVNDQWQAIGTVDGHGTATSQHSYKFADRDYRQGNTAYYRLKQVDFDGSYEYSEVRAVSSELAEAFRFITHPNPVRDRLILTLNAIHPEKATVVIRNALGQQVLSRRISLQKGRNRQALSLKFLKGGPYFLSIKTAEQVHHQKIVKE